MSGQPQNTRHSINQIAEAEQVPRDFLAKILKELTQAGIIKSYQGVHGGYQLSKTPNQITVLNIIEAMNGPLALNLCIRGKHKGECEKNKNCSMLAFFRKMQIQVEKMLKDQTMAKFHRTAKAK